MSEIKEHKHINWRDHLSTIFGFVLAILNAWENVEWSTFRLDRAHLIPLFISAAIAIGGKYTSINKLK
jgi:hypothetical protein